MLNFALRLAFFHSAGLPAMALRISIRAGPSGCQMPVPRVSSTVSTRKKKPGAGAFLPTSWRKIAAT